MSEQWRGHYARCLECENLCASGEPCRCCLTAEVEAVREKVARFDTEARVKAAFDFLLSDESQQAEHIAVHALVEVEVLRAQVQRVRDLCDALRRTHQDYAAMVIEMTLDGGESDE